MLRDRDLYCLKLYETSGPFPHTFRPCRKADGHRERCGPTTTEERQKEVARVRSVSGKAKPSKSSVRRKR